MAVHHSLGNQFEQLHLFDPGPAKPSEEQRFRETNPYPEEYQTRAEARDVAATSRMMIRAPLSGVSGITGTGRFKTQHETGTSKGTLDPTYRATFEDRAFGKGKRPVYGYISHGDVRDELGGGGNSWDAVSMYGKTAFVLKEHVRPHTTYTLGDSLGSESESITKQGKISEGTIYGGHPLDLYTEMQVHKPGLGLQDVSHAIHYDTGAWTSRHYGSEGKYESENRRDTATATALLRQAGVPHEVREIGVGGQKVLPLGDQWGDAAWVHGHNEKTKDIEPGRGHFMFPHDVEEPMVKTTSRWSPQFGDLPVSPVKRGRRSIGGGG